MRFNPTRSSSSALFVLPLLMLAAACGGDAGQESAPESEAAAQEPDPNIVTASPREALTELDYGTLAPEEVALTLDWTRNRVTRDHDEGQGTSILSEVDTRRETGFDRIVLHFDRIPGYDVQYAGETSGCTVAAEGGEVSYLAIRLDRARASEDGSPLVLDRSRSLGMPALEGASQTCDEGDQVIWMLALSAETDFRVLETLGEPRLVIDLRHP